MKLAFAVILALSTIPSMVIAQDTGRSAKTKAPADHHRICVTQDVTGSRMPVSICRTKADWDAIEKSKGLPLDTLNIPSGQH